MAEFDSRRALLVNKDIFVPFRVTSTSLLWDALSRGDLPDGAPVLVVERGAATLVLLTQQLLYHHVAQGELAGEPWMVSY
jgi:hypothetical protein